MRILRLAAALACLSGLSIMSAVAQTADTKPLAGDDPGVIEGDVPFVTPDMTAFDATCRASDALLNWMSSGTMTGEQAREKVCDCLVEEFPLEFQQSTVDILAKTFDGTITDAERAAYTNYETFAKRAEEVMGTCISRAGL
jgi:hypothetical protein